MQFLTFKMKFQKNIEIHVTKKKKKRKKPRVLPLPINWEFKNLYNKMDINIDSVVNGLCAI